MKPVYKPTWIYNYIMSDLMHNMHDNNIWVTISRYCSDPHLLEQYNDKIKWISLSQNQHIMTFIDFDFLKNNIDKLDNFVISGNIDAVPFLELHPEKINYNELCRNPNAIHLIKNKMHDYKVYECICWDKLSSNYSDNALDILERYFYRINWKQLSINKNNRAIKLLRQNPSKIDWDKLSGNSNPKAIQLIEELNPNMVGINWVWMSLNKNAISLLERNLDKVYWNYLSISEHDNNILFLKTHYEKINWEYLSRNPNKEAIKILEANLDKINWYWLSGNKNAYHILKNHLDKMNMSKFMANSGCIDVIKETLNSEMYIINTIHNNDTNSNTNINTNINTNNNRNDNNNKIKRLPFYIINNVKCHEILFKLDYDKMKENENSREFLRELQEYVFEPNRLERISRLYNIDFIDLLRIY